MNQLQYDEENNPFKQLLMLVGYTVLGVLIGSIISIVLISILYGFDILGSLSNHLVVNQEKINSLKIMQVFTSIGLFMTGPLWLAYAESGNVFGFYAIKKTNIKTALMAFLLLLVSTPFLEYVSVLNQNMRLPDFLISLENWFKIKEKEAQDLTLIFLKGSSVLDLGVNLFVVALIPAIAEELMFRGALQHIFSRIFSNKHLTIWLVAIIFSTIHLQFYGFLPRVLLGAGFGYLYYWTNNIVYAMIAHFINNALAVLMAWKMQKENIPLDQLETETYFSSYIYVISIILTLLLGYYFNHKIKNHDSKLD